MTVCVRLSESGVRAQANELELALDVYNQLLREGCQPNLVTYNILIDIYGKMGSWQEAVQVLDALEGQVSHAVHASVTHKHTSCEGPGCLPWHGVDDTSAADGADKT